MTRAIAHAEKANTAAHAEKANSLWRVNPETKDVLVPKTEPVTAEKVAHVLPAIDEIIPKI